MVTKIEIISLKETSNLLGVSDATVRNWVNSGYLNAVANTQFDLEEVKRLNVGFVKGRSERLNGRANKRNSNVLFIPDEYISETTVIHALNEVLSIVEKYELEKEKVLYALSVLLLEKYGLTKVSDTFEINKSITRESIQDELDEWLNLNDNIISDGYLELKKVELPTNCDFLGLIHQSLSTEGVKAQAGSYYTPKNLVDEIVNETVEKDDYVLDPCCGTGQFLISASKKLDNPERIWGFDIDLQAVRIAKINLILEFPEVVFKPNIYHKNTLLDLQVDELFLDIEIPEFDSVITNPPWGAHFTQNETKQLKINYPEIKSNEAFSYFIKKSYELLKEGGKLSFVLPEAILNIKTHSDIRHILLTETKIKKIAYLNKIFKNVFTPVLRIDFIKSYPKEKHSFISQNKTNSFAVTQSTYLQNPDYTLNVFNGKNDANLFEKIYNLKHVTLQGNAEWALGIVTGNNKAHLVTSPDKNLEPILTGKDIKRYVTKTATNYINFEPSKFQQIAPIEKYRAKEKLLYKFISKQLVFAYDDNQALTLNSANILIPTLDYPTRTILALFNSTPYQFLYQKKFGAIKVLRKDIERLPLPALDKKEHNAIEKMVNALLKQDLTFEERKQNHQELDNYIIGLFGFSTKEKQYLLDEVKNSEKLLKIS